MEKVNRIALVDLAHIFRRAWHAGENRELSFALENCKERLYSILDQGYDKVVCAIDRPPYFRSTLYPDYKGQRAQMTPEFHEQYRDAQHMAKKLGCLVWGVETFEADDIIASAVRLSLDESDREVDVYTGDKDLLQLVGEYVTVVSTTTGDRMGPAEVEEKMGIWPAQMVDYLALVGDKSDNIPGCPGCGPKTAASMLAEAGTLDTIFSIVGDGLTPKGCNNKSVLAALADPETQKLIKTGRELIQLHYEVELPWHELFEEKEESEMESRDEYEGEVGVVDSEDNALSVSEGGKKLADEVEYKPEEKKEDAPLAISHHESDLIPLGPGRHVSDRSLNLAYRMAKGFHAGGLYRRKFDSPETILTVMLLGMELGITPQVACQNFHVVEGKPTPAAHFLIALAKRDKNCAYFECIETDSSHAVYVTKKKNYPKELRFEYTIEQAERAGMNLSKGNWKSRPDEMIRKTAGSQAARLWYPEATSGLYSMAEMGYDEEES